jgi:hypothetical protein
MIESARAVLLVAAVFTMEAGILFLIAWRTSVARGPLWLRWLIGASAYVMYAAIVGAHVPLLWSNFILGTASAVFRVAFEGPSSRSPDSRALIIAYAWAALAAIPACVLLLARLARAPFRCPTRRPRARSDE